jgi:hypothetical protein
MSFAGGAYASAPWSGEIAIASSSPVVADVLRLGPDIQFPRWYLSDRL